MRQFPDETWSLLVLYLQLAKEAIEVEEKEEKLVGDAVRHLAEANVKINVLTEEFSSKADESRRQKEEITHLLAKVSLSMPLFIYFRTYLHYLPHCICIIHA